MKVFAIIVTYNGMHRDWISKCLTSLKHSTMPITSIVVDNNSSDGTVDFIKKNHPEVILTQSDKNLGFGGANNIGISEALNNSADAVFLLNQDATIEPNTIAVLAELSKKYPEYGIISPLQLDGTGDRLEWGFSNSVGYDYNKDFFSDYVLNKPKKDIYSSRISYAASWFLSKECLRKVGGFNPSFFHYGEDDNYCQRVLYKKMKIGFTPLTFILHDTYHKPESTLNKQTSYLASEIRHKTLSLSAPGSNLNLSKLTAQYKNKIIKNLILLNRKEYQLNKDILKFLKEKGNFIVENRKISESQIEYAFIKIIDLNK